MYPLDERRVQVGVDEVGGAVVGGAGAGAPRTNTPVEPVEHGSKTAGCPGGRVTKDELGHPLQVKWQAGNVILVSTCLGLHLDLLLAHVVDDILFELLDHVSRLDVIAILHLTGGLISALCSTLSIMNVAEEGHESDDDDQAVHDADDKATDVVRAHSALGFSRLLRG